MKIQIRLAFIIFFLQISFGVFAQGKFYVTPQVFAFVGSYQGVDSVNGKQTILKTRNFARKDFLVGINVAYQKEPYMITIGIEQAAYSSSFYYKKDGRIYHKTGYSGINLINYYLELQYDYWVYNKKIPKKWTTNKETNKYLIVSKISPFIGLDYLRYNKNNLSNGRGNISSPGFKVSYELETFPYLRDNLGIRTGVNWTFFNGEKKKLTLTLAYKFGFGDIAYHRYHFQNQNTGVDFYYQTTTKGNGFSIKAGFPIKLLTINKK